MVCQMQWFCSPREIHRARQSPFYVREWHILVLNGINWVPSSTLPIVLLLIISVLSIVVVLDVFLEGNSSNLRVACGAFSLINHCRVKVISAHCRWLRSWNYVQCSLSSTTGESYFRALSSRLSSMGGSARRPGRITFAAKVSSMVVYCWNK